EETRSGRRSKRSAAVVMPLQSCYRTEVLRGALVRLVFRGGSRRGTPLRGRCPGSEGKEAVRLFSASSEMRGRGCLLERLVVAFPRSSDRAGGKKGVVSVKREGRILSTLVAAGLFLGLTSTAHAILFDDQSSLTQPATELVMPFDASDNKSSFLLVSNPDAVSFDAAQVSTHWIFWGTNCRELADVSICLTLNDTIVVDPRNITSVGPDNEPLGPTVNLDGEKGIVTVTAYE